MKPVIRQHGFSLLEITLALLLSSVVMLGSQRLLPQVVAQVRMIEQRHALRQEMYRLIRVVEKAIRRAGYCFGEQCIGAGLSISEQGQCLLLRWDDNHNGQWEATAHPLSDYFAFRYRPNVLEFKRGTAQCSTSQWSRLNDPNTVRITRFSVAIVEDRLKITLSAQSGRLQLTQTHLIKRENYP